jgi:Ribbon-helix-helix domain
MVRKKGNRVHLDIYLDPGKHEQLQRLSELTLVPMAAYLRKAVDDLLSKKEYAAMLRKPSRKGD